MKIAPLLIAVCVLSVLTGCRKSQSSQVVGPVEDANIKTVALASIAAKYTNFDSLEFTFEGIIRKTTTSGHDFIVVSYIIPTPAKTNEDDTSEGKRVKIIRKLVYVRMSPEKEIQSVYEGERWDFKNVDK